jgi:hypothetical protein
LLGQQQRKRVHRERYAGGIRVAADSLAALRDVDISIRWLECRTEALVELRWQEIEKLARALLERETLTIDEVRELLFGEFRLQAAKFVSVASSRENRGA